MKNLLVLLSVFWVSALSGYAYNYKLPVTNEVKDTQSVYYNMETKEWSRSQLNQEDLFFTKYMTKGSGGYSEYDTAQKQYDMGAGSTYEFLDGTSLIGYNAHTLKFYKFTFNGEKFEAQELTPTEVQSYFPDVVIVKISSFKNNKITVRKPWFKPASFMLLNDTNTDFYKYQFENQQQYQLIKGVFEMPKNMFLPKTLIYSHFASKDPMFPKFEITVKNGR